MSKQTVRQSQNARGRTASNVEPSQRVETACLAVARFVVREHLPRRFQAVQHCNNGQRAHSMLAEEDSQAADTDPSQPASAIRRQQCTKQEPNHTARQQHTPARTQLGGRICTERQRRLEWRVRNERVQCAVPNQVFGRPISRRDTTKQTG